MGKKKKIIQTELMSPVEVYKLVLSGRLKKFPQHFWSEADGQDNAREVTRYLFEEILKWNDEDIKLKFDDSLIKKYRLNGMRISLKMNMFQIVDNVYPNKFREWELVKVPKYFWNRETEVEAIRWLFEEKLKWTEQDIKKKLTHHIFAENGLAGMKELGRSPFRALEAAYPGRFKETDLLSAPFGYWTRKRFLSALRELLDNELKWSHEDIAKNISDSLLHEYGLYSMIKFYPSGMEAVMDAYPGEFREWEFYRVPKGFWNRENGIKAVRWLAETKLKLSPEEIPEKLTRKVFKEHRMSSMLRLCFECSSKKALKAAYPELPAFKKKAPQAKQKEKQKEKFERLALPPAEMFKLVLSGQIHAFPPGFWQGRKGRENAREITRYLIEDILKWSDDEVKNKFSAQVLIEYKLSGMKYKCLENSLFKVIDNAYPGKYKPWELAVVGHGFWTDENCRCAIKWLVEEKLEIDTDAAGKKIMIKDFNDHGLMGLLNVKFANSPVKAIEFAYPGKFR